MHESIDAIVMRRVYIFVWHLTWLSLLLHFKSLYTSEETGYEYYKGCSHLRCDSGGQCIKRRFWCKHPPCPGMLYCSKSRKESLKGPLACDTVHCSKGHVCIVKVGGCRWDDKCKQQIARCVLEKEYYEGAASCAGFECPSGKRCILRESYCISPPCKLLKSCAEAKDVQIWFDKCRTLGCPSEYECFLRRPDNNCRDPSCRHTPDCTYTTEEELISKYCRGWICPRTHKCVIQFVGPCKGYNCTIERSCHESRIIASSTTPVKYDSFINDQVAEQPPTKKSQEQIETELIRQELERRGMSTQASYPLTRKKPNSATTLSTRKQTAHYTASQKHVTEQVPVIHQQVWTNPISKPIESSSSNPMELFFTLPYPRSWLNYNKSSTTDTTGSGLKITDEDETFKITSKPSDWSDNSSFPATLPAERKIEPTTSRDTKKLEVMKKIYIANDNPLQLPMVLEGINFVGQYPIWIKNEVHRPLAVKDEDGSGGRYREPYRFLLPPYEPLILVEDAEQFLPFLSYGFDRPFNEAALISLSQITSTDATVNSKTDNILTTVRDKIDNRINSSIAETDNFKTNHYDDSSDHYANFAGMEETNQVLPNIRDKQLNNNYDDYEWRSWYVIHDYLEKKEPQLIREQKFKSGVDDFATHDLNTPVASQITKENKDGAFERRYFAYNKNLATSHPSLAPISMEPSDYDYREEEEHYDPVNHGTTIVRDTDESGRRGSSLDEISDITLSDEENQPENMPTTFSYGRRENERPTPSSLHETSPYRDGDSREYDEYCSHENYDNIGDHVDGATS